MVCDRSSRRVDTPGEKLVGFWVWEYVLKHTSDVNVVRELTEALPFPSDAPRLKQMTLLRQLASDVSTGFDIERMPDSLEALRNAFETEPVDNAAAAAAAEPVESEDVALSRRFKASSSKAPKAEDSVWQGLRQPTLELQEKVQALLRLSAGENAQAYSAKVKAIEHDLSALIKNAWALFGPAFLERAEAAVLSGKYKPQGVEMSLPPAFQQNVNAADKGVSNSRDEDDLPTEPPRRVVDECRMELRRDISGKNKDLERTRLEFVDSYVGFPKLVKDPLPTLLRKPEEVAQTLTPSKTPRQAAAAAAEPGVKRSLLERHPSAQAQHWDEEEEDEIAESPPSPSASRRVQLPLIHSPERAPVLRIRPPAGESPFAARSSSGTKLRRPRNKWTEEEVETLKREVRKYGKGRWKIILQNNPDVFCERTEVDIKDKWRNLEKYNVV